MIYKNFKQITEYCRKNYIVDKQYNLCFDVGSNIGGFIEANKNNFNKIIGIESIPETFIELKKNVGNYSNVELLNIAVSNEENKTLKFYKHKNNEAGSVSSKIAEEMNNEEPFVEIETTTLKKLINKFGTPNYIKVDCEGCEYDFLMGQNLDGIDFISIEIHFDLLKDKERENLLNFLCIDFEIVKSKEGKKGFYHSEYNLKRKNTN